MEKQHEWCDIIKTLTVWNREVWHMRKRKAAAVILIVIMFSVCLAGCSAEQENASAPGGHVAYGISYEVPETDWVYMFNSDRLGNGDEWIDLEISGCDGKPYVPEGARKANISGRECYLCESRGMPGEGTSYWSKVLLIPYADGDKYIEIRDDFIEEQAKAEADAFFEDVLNGLEFTGDEGYIVSKDYISVGGVRIPAKGLRPCQFFYGLMDEENAGGMISLQIDFDDKGYKKGLEETFFKIVKDNAELLLGDGAIKTCCTDNKWYTILDGMPGGDEMTYLSHVVMIPVDELQTIMRIEYDFDGEVEDLGQYNERIKELDGQIHAAETE